MATYTTLRQGSSGADVKKLQNALINAGYDVGSSGADGIYGAKTAAAVTAYQKANNLTVDGIAGNQTLGSLYASNSTNTNNAPSFDGVDQKYVDVTQKDYVPSEEETGYKSNRDEAAQSMVDKINKGPQFSESVTKAFEYLQGQQEYFKNGKTSWDDKIFGQIEKIENREDFSYDVDSDQLFQQALSSAMKSGKSAMQDTIGQASMLTGGYGSSYATSAGNQAYNAFIEDAYNNLPEYYQMALQAYQMEGEEMYNLLGMYTQMGEQEWNRNFDAYNTVFDYANSQRNFEYGMYQDDITNTYNTMNLYDSFYKQANTENMAMWQQEIENAWKIIEQQSSDYWNQKNYDESVRQFNLSRGDTNNDGVIDESEKKAANSVDDIPNAISTKAGNFENNGELEEYLDAQVTQGTLTEEQADYLYSANMSAGQLPLTERTWTMTNDGGNNWFDGIDRNGKAKDQYGNEYTMAELYRELKKTMTDSDAKDWIKMLQYDIGITKR